MRFPQRSLSSRRRGGIDSRRGAGRRKGGARTPMTDARLAEWLIPVLLALTTTATYWVGSRRLGLPARALASATGRALEALGATLIFFAVNFGLSLIVAFGVRSFTDGFL